MKNITVKSVCEKDAPLLRHLAKNCAPLDVHTQYTYWAVSKHFDDCCFIAYDCETPIGFIMCIKNDTTFFVWQIGIIEKYRTQGYSKLLVEKAFGYAEKNGLKLISVTIAKENLNSFYTFRNYCRNNGYSFEEVDTVFVSDLDDKSFREEEIMYHIKKDAE